MAEIDNYLTGPSTPDPERNLGTAGDFAKTLGAGVAGVGSNLAGALRYGWELGGSEAGADISRGLQQIFSAGQDSISDTINPETRKLAASALTSEDFWAHPILATSLKATGMLPSVAALAIPGGLMADVVGASVMAAVGGGVLQAGEGLDEFYQKLDAMSDKELQEQSPKYKAMRELMDEKDARVRFNRQAQGFGPAINAVLGAVTGLVGPGGVAARGLAGGGKNAVLGAGERGALGSAAVGAGEGAATNALQEGAADVIQQGAEIDADFQKEFDRARTANAALEGGALGGLFGGAVSLVAGGHKSAKPPKLDSYTPELPASSPRAEAVATTDTPDAQLKNGSTGIAAKPAEIEANPQNAPSTTTRDMAKDQPKTKTAVVTEGTSPLDPAIVAATNAEKGTPAPSAAPTEVAAMEKRSPNETLDKLDAAETQGANDRSVVAPAAPVTPEGNAPQLDTGQNVPEKPASIKEQIAQIGTGDRKAVMMPKGTVVGAANLNGRTDLKSTVTPRGRFIYDPKLTTPAEIRKLSAAGRENELLGLGPVSKPTAVADVAAGATPVAITERTPAGTEVKAAAGSTATLPEQRAALEAAKTPGNVVAVETPQQVVAKRVLPNLAVTGETTPLSAFNGKLAETSVKPEVGTKGKNYRGKAGEARDAALTHAKDVVAAYPPNPDAEEGYHRLPVRRDVVVKRLREMVADAEKRLGKPIQTQIKKSAKGDSLSDDPNVLILRLAKDVVRTADKNPQGKTITDLVAQFKSREALVRAGAADEVIAERLAEGEQHSRRSTQEQVENAADDSVPYDARNDEISNDEQVGADVVEEAAPDVTATDNVAESVGEVEEASPDIEQGRSVKHIEVKQEKAKSNLSPREARKAALAATAASKLSKGAPDRAPIKSSQQAMNPSPTEAQKEAGNYKKGHRRVEGLEFTIENPKGAIRSGRGPDGTWRVTMPADYGYIRRTVGADGDHVDAYDGRSGSRNFIVDQLDARTGEFDEHKVMLRFKDEEHAVDTYERAFSDGNGRARLGYLHEVTTPELKEWLGQGNTQEPHLKHVVGDVAERVEGPRLDAMEERPTTDVWVQGTDKKVRALRSSTAREELANLDFSKLPGAAGKLNPFFQRQLLKLAGDVEVHYVDEANMKKAVSNYKEGQPASLGLHNYGSEVGTGRTGVSQIFINDTVMRGVGWEDHGQIILHELVHAVTSREIETLPGAKAGIRSLMAAAEKHYDANLVELDQRYKVDGKLPLEYGFTNEHEFMAEAFSNPHFQNFLSTVPIDRATAEYFGLREKRNNSIWDAIKFFAKRAVEKITGKLPNDSVMDAMLRVGEHFTNIHAEDGAPSVHGLSAISKHDFAATQAQFISARAADHVKSLLESRAANESAPKALKLRTFDNIARIADHYFGENNPVRKIHSAIERTRVTAEAIAQASEPILRNLTALRAANRPAYEALSSLLHDATIANVHPDVPLTDAKNAHLGKNAMRGVWAKEQHKELSKRFRMLPEAYQKAFHDVTGYFRGQQNKMSLSIIENQILKLADVKLPAGTDYAALARRVHENTLTDADRAAIGPETLDILEKAGELSKIEGPYVPLMRRGDHVVKGDYKVTPPGNATVISNSGGDVEFEFTSRKEAEDYARSSKLKAELEKIWVDGKTGERTGANELDAVDRYRVTVQNRHVEFVEGKRAADARAAELAKDGSIAVHKVVPRSREPNTRQGAELSTALTRLVKKLERSDAYQAATPTQKAALRQAIEEAALASHGSTRVSSRALPRRNVKGYSEDLTQNLSDYAFSSGHYLAKLEHAPQLEAGMKAMAEQLDSDHSKTGQYARTAISNEVRDRVEGDNGFQQGGAFAPVVKRLLSASFTDKLASPAYSIINAMQPGMVTMPYLSGKYGATRSFSELGRAYVDINSGRILKEGAVGTARAARGKEAGADLMTLVKRKLSADERAMIDHNIAEGVIDGNAGMEIQNIARSYEGLGGKTDAVLAYMEGVSREMPRAIETINRAVTALATYRLERAKGADHAKALQASTDAVNSTQFNYSPTNSPGVFNHPLLKIALQFKKYGQGMYQLIGSQIGDAIRNAEPGDRARAIKTLTGIAATHMAMAGALGLPTEPFKYLVLAASPFTGVSWGDVENEVRKQAAALFGKAGGEIATRGLPRFLNLDLSRMGLDSVTSFGEPRGGKESDVKSWLFDSVSGPVVSLGGDYVKGLNHIANGEYVKAAEKMIPLKAAADSIRAYRQYSEGKKTAGGKQSSAPYSPAEAGLRALGFGTGREAEEGAQRGAFYRGSEKQKEERSSLVNKWVQAAPEQKAKSWAAIQQYNQSAPSEAKITAKELTDKARRDAKDAEKAKLGIVPSKRDKRFLDEGVYNLR